jgi:hypothetical protein
MEISPDALCLILEQQPLTTIFACRLVCRRWDDIISRQPQLYHGKFMAWYGNKISRRALIQEENQRRYQAQRKVERRRYQAQRGVELQRLCGYQAKSPPRSGKKIQIGSSWFFTE